MRRLSAVLSAAAVGGLCPFAAAQHPVPVPAPPAVIDPCPAPVVPCPPAGVVCPPACPDLAPAPCPGPVVYPAPARRQRVEVVVPPPEVIRVPAAAGRGAEVGLVGGEAGAAAGRFKSCLLNININRTRTKTVGGGGQMPVTQIIPAFATATIPIAFQTTQFTTLTQPLAGRTEAALTRTDIRELARAIAAESAREDEARGQQESARRGQPESAVRGQPETATRATDCCDELKTRLTKVEARLDAIQKQVETIASRLPAK